MLKNKIVRVRWVKPYPTAHNHVAIGEVIAETENYLSLRCKTYHFGDHVGGKKAKLRAEKYIGGIMEGVTATRIVPWHRIEIINELPASTDWDIDAFVDESGFCHLNDERKTAITRAPERNE
jgi:hypothetical protein